jgi:6-phosphogluconolactonase
MKLRVFETAADLFQGAATEFVSRADSAIRERGRFCVALSGGFTPKGLFNLLASRTYASFPWDKTFLFWGDERYVPADHPESNFRMAQEALLSKILIPAKNVFPIDTAKSPAEAAAKEYEQTVKSFFDLKPGEFPRFDLTLNGIGTEGHTASLFPDSPALNDRTNLAVAVWVERFNMFRITMTLPVFNNSACVLFLASGREKNPILQEVFEKPSSRLPAQRIVPTHGELLWFVDRPAAGTLS